MSIKEPPVPSTVTLRKNASISNIIEGFGNCFEGDLVKFYQPVRLLRYSVLDHGFKANCSYQFADFAGDYESKTSLKFEARQLPAERRRSQVFTAWLQL